MNSLFCNELVKFSKIESKLNFLNFKRVFNQNFKNWNVTIDLTWCESKNNNLWSNYHGGFVLSFLMKFSLPHWTPLPHEILFHSSCTMDYFTSVTLQKWESKFSWIVHIASGRHQIYLETSHFVCKPNFSYVYHVWRVKISKKEQIHEKPMHCTK